MFQSCIDGWFYGGGPFYRPLYPLEPDVSQGPPGLSGGKPVLGPPRNSTTVDYVIMCKIEVKQEESEQSEVDGMKEEAGSMHRWAATRRKQGRTRVTTDEDWGGPSGFYL